MTEPQLRVAIVDDEAPARAILREYLEQEAGLRPLAVSPLDTKHSALVLVDVQRKMIDRKIDPSIRVKHAGDAERIHADQKA